MDTISHIAVSTLTGQTARSIYKGRIILWFCLLAGVFPDIDNIAGLWGIEAYLRYHRGITHSFIGGLLLSLILVAIFRFSIKSFPFIKGFGLAYLMFALHIFLDLITSYGTQIFLPFTDHRYTFNSVFIIDPIYTITIIIMFILSVIFFKRRMIIGIVGIIWIFSYPVINFSIKNMLDYQIKNNIIEAGVNFKSIHILPDFLSPIFWKVIIDQESYYHMAGINMFHLDKTLELKGFSKADKSLLQELAKKDSFFNTYLWFSTYLVMEKRPSNIGVNMIIYDLKYASTVPLLKKRFINLPPFSLTLLFNQEGLLYNYNVRH
ncbi:MAG: metal-dependent hydrolase [Desulfobacterales bacterium]|nr:metal-dependent hydrolase [Desulfobacterales bacterium]MBF0398314.1 metal-dependent hydrolase [Desulfobacterales bacterium]